MCVQDHVGTEMLVVGLLTDGSGPEKELSSLPMEARISNNYYYFNCMMLRYGLRS